MASMPSSTCKGDRWWLTGLKYCGLASDGKKASVSILCQNMVTRRGMVIRVLLEIMGQGGSCILPDFQEAALTSIGVAGFCQRCELRYGD